MKKPMMSKSETITFISLIEDQPSITTKETNAVNNRLKEDGWCDLTDKYNSICDTTPRTTAQLKAKWDNLKKAARKRATTMKEYTKPVFPPDDILDKVIALLEPCTGFSVPFEGDAESSTPSSCKDDTIINFYNMQDACDDGTGDKVTPRFSDNPTHCCMCGAQKRSMESMDGTSLSTSKINKKTKKTDNMFQSKDKKNHYDDGRRQMNLAIAAYYKKKAEKLDLEIKILKKCNSGLV